LALKGEYFENISPVIGRAFCGQRHVADLIEEEGAAVGLGDLAGGAPV